jgi:hypothetical protein
VRNTSDVTRGKSIATWSQFILVWVRLILYFPFTTSMLWIINKHGSVRMLLHQSIDRWSILVDGRMKQSTSIDNFYQTNRSILDRRYRSVVELICHRHHVPTPRRAGLFDHRRPTSLTGYRSMVRRSASVDQLTLLDQSIADRSIGVVTP